MAEFAAQQEPGQPPEANYTPTKMDNSVAIATVIAGFLGLLALLIATALTVRATRSLEERKRAAQLAAEAILDLLLATAENSEANGYLRRSGATGDPYWHHKLADSRVRFISAKARLTTFASAATVKAAVSALAGDFTGADAGDQKRFAELVQRVRSEMHPHDDKVPTNDLIAMFFGLGAEALDRTS
jgi:hypothetical protein